MIRHATIIAILLLFLFTGGVFFQAFYSKGKGESIEEVLTQKISIPKHEEAFSTKQIRKGVVKDLWLNDREGTRLHHHIESPQSILTAIPCGTRVELIEQMIEMKCYFQEKVEEEGGEEVQQIRYLQSGEGTYRYTDQHFNAQSVFLALYKVSGKTLSTQLNTQDAYIKGVAEEVSLSFSNGSPDFHAEKFKAQIRAQGKIL
ncbi:MAG: hypothetical protein KDK76_03180 [Chlamydiia bacterium]|nr:hypothetical protein [Chlamydiia bacterium]